MNKEQWAMNMFVSAAQYLRGKALQALSHIEEAHSAWQQGAAGLEGSGQQNKHRDLCKEALETLK